MKLRRTAITLTAVVSLGLGLAACGGDDDKKKETAPSASSSAPASAPPVAPEPKGGEAVAGPLKITGAYIPQPAKPDMAGGYMVIDNPTDTADTLLSVSAPELTDMAQIHETVDGKMQELKAGLPIPAKGKGLLARNGNHVMFMMNKHPLKQGDKVQLTLKFEKAGEVKIEVPVLAAADRPADTTSEAPTGHSGH